MSQMFLGLDEEQWFFIVLFVLIIIYVGNLNILHEVFNTIWPLLVVVLYGLDQQYFSLSPREETWVKDEKRSNLENQVTQNETVPAWENTEVGVDDLLKYQETEAIKPAHMGEVDIDVYLDCKPIQETHKQMGSVGDNRMVNRMKFSAIQAKESHDSWARFNSEKMRRIFEDELQEQENRDWWEAEQDYLDDYM